MRRVLLLVAGVCLCGVAAARPDDPGVPAWAKGIAIGNPMRDARGVREVSFSDPAAWKVGTDADGNGCLELAYDRKAYKSTYVPKHRSPVHVAVLRQYPLTDFALDVEAMSTTEEYGHQDVCLFFGMQSPEKYYYAHLAPKPDANAHNVFVVNAADRKNLLPPQKAGVTWKKDTWHKLRLVRQATAGKVEVYFDDMTKPVLAAEDKTFQEGFAGFGSFDDTARFRNFKLYTMNLTIGRQADFFKPLGK